MHPLGKMLEVAAERRGESVVDCTGGRPGPSSSAGTGTATWSGREVCRCSGWSREGVCIPDDWAKCWLLTVNCAKM